MTPSLRSILEWFFGIGNSTNTQSSTINGNGNSVDQSVNHITIITGTSQDVRESGGVSENENAAGNSRLARGRTLNTATLIQAARLTEKPVTIFLAGPYIEPETKSDSSGSAASILRFQLFHRLKGEKFEVSLGTYPDLTNSFESETGNYHNAAEAELGHAKDVASLVVMIPNSPGSFAEIGAFSLKREICKKMLILADVTHEKSLGYLNTGPVACAKALGSTIENVDYTDVESCFEIVRTYSNKVRIQIQLNARLQG